MNTEDSDKDRLISFSPPSKREGAAVDVKDVPAGSKLLPDSQIDSSSSEGPPGNDIKHEILMMTPTFCPR